MPIKENIMFTNNVLGAAKKMVDEHIFRSTQIKSFKNYMKTGSRAQSNHEILIKCANYMLKTTST